MGLLDGKVILITGSGGGIGRCHALACAREGAKIVVNDLGGARDGTGAGAKMADQVVDEICALGGEALANYDSVTDYEGCERMVQDALERWGRLDVIVNNAGILRDKTFSKMTDDQWSLVLDVHLNGTRNVTKAALEALKVNGGAIINTSSYSGLIGNFGQSNYGAAKAGIYGFTRVLSMELRKYGITANCVSPVAKTRMTEDIAVVEDDWGPEQISPIVVYLASELAKTVTGRVFGVQGQRIHLYEMQTNPGVEKPGKALWTAQEIHEKFNEIAAFEQGPPEAGNETDDTVSEVFSHFPSGFKPSGVANWTANLQWVVQGASDQSVIIENGNCSVQKGLVGNPTCTVKIPKQVLLDLFMGRTDPQKVFMTGKATADNMGDLMKMAMAFDFDAIAKAASGSSSEPVVDSSAVEPSIDEGEKVMPIGKRYEGGYWLVDEAEYKAYAAATDDLNGAYAGSDSVAPPMYHVKPFIDVMFKMASDPELELDLLRLVHAEHDMTFHKTMKHGDVLQLRGTLKSVEEKSSGRLVRYGLVGFLDGEVALEGGTSYFVRGKKRKGGEKSKPKDAPSPPPAPNWVMEQQVKEDQALRYAAASGDDNPIHTDENTAQAAGLPKCILHGLCTMALAQRDIVAQYCDGDPSRLQRLAVRWAKPVFPGDGLQLKVWEQGEGKLSFITENGTGQVVMMNGRAEIRPA